MNTSECSVSGDTKAQSRRKTRNAKRAPITLVAIPTLLGRSAAPRGAPQTQRRKSILRRRRDISSIVFHSARPIWIGPPAVLPSPSIRRPPSSPSWLAPVSKSHRSWRYCSRVCPAHPPSRSRAPPHTLHTNDNAARPSPHKKERNIDLGAHLQSGTIFVKSVNCVVQYYL